MKKLFAAILGVVFILSGCTVNGSGLQPSATGSGKSSVVEFTVSPTAEPTVEPTVEPTPVPTPEPTEKPGEAVIKQKVFKVWKDSIKSIWISVACEIENVGESPVSLDNVTFTVLDKDGGVLDTMSTNIPTPDILGKGEIAYAHDETILDTVSDPKAVASIEVNCSFSATKNTSTLLEVSGAKFYPPKKSYDDPKVTGWVTNTSTETVDQVRVAAALYDKDGNLLCVLYDYVDAAINAGAKASFEASALSVAPNISKSVASVKCVAFNWELHFD